MARMPKQDMKPGMPDKPVNLSDRASKEWDKLATELAESNIRVSKAHRALIAQAATIAADIAEAWEIVQEEGPYLVNAKTSAVYAHPASRRLDRLRTEQVKLLSLIGLRAAVQEALPSARSLKDVLDQD
jgi:P27 family predicted phage terminase small subunit